MKFLIDADSPHSLVAVFNKHGYKAVHVRHVLGSAAADEIFEYAQNNVKEMANSIIVVELGRYRTKKL